VQTREPITAQRVTELLSAAPGIALEDVPSPLQAEGRDEVFVGRIRGDDSAPNAFSMFVVSDNLRKGAATNAVQLAELVAKQPVP
jgi:aspartate-semialdehyde dehydrogenase